MAVIDHTVLNRRAHDFARWGGMDAVNNDTHPDHFTALRIWEELIEACEDAGNREDNSVIEGIERVVPNFNY